MERIILKNLEDIMKAEKRQKINMHITWDFKKYDFYDNSNEIAPKIIRNMTNDEIYELIDNLRKECFEYQLIENMRFFEFTNNIAVAIVFDEGDWSILIANK